MHNGIWPLWRLCDHNKCKQRQRQQQQKKHSSYDASRLDRSPTVERLPGIFFLALHFVIFQQQFANTEQLSDANSSQSCKCIHVQRNHSSSGCARRCANRIILF